MYFQDDSQLYSVIGRNIKRIGRQLSLLRRSLQISLESVLAILRNLNLLSVIRVCHYLCSII